MALTSPAGPGAMGSSLVTGDDGAVYLSWIEPSGVAQNALKFSVLDAASHRWQPAHTIAQGANWFLNWADFPAMAVEKNGRLTAVWYVNNPPEPMPAHHEAGHDHHGAGYHAEFSQSTDHGTTWSAARPVSAESASVEFVSLVPLTERKILAAWLDGRGKKAGGPAEQLYSRVLGGSGPDVLVDASVCDCCQTTLTGFADGSALIAYRGRTTEEIRDVRTMRYDSGQWQQPGTSTRDGWKIAGCPVNGPQLASRGPRAALAWFTGADNEPRVLASTSPDAGGLYTMAQRVDLGHPTGRVDTLLLRGGTQLVSWLEEKSADDSQPAGIYLRRITFTGSTMTPALLAPATSARASGFPRMALVKDFDDYSPAQLVVAFTRAEDPMRVDTILVTLPDAAVLAEADKNCDCAGTPEQENGFPIRGKIEAIAKAQSTLRMNHLAIPGLLPAGAQEFKVAPDLLETVKTGGEILARIEERSDGWWLFDVRLLVSPHL